MVEVNGVKEIVEIVLWHVLYLPFIRELMKIKKHGAMECFIGFNMN